MFKLGVLAAERGDAVGASCAWQRVTRPSGLDNGEYQVNDPGFDPRPLWQIVPDYAWMQLAD